ncbi:MAG: NAD(P)/FAD-dependent oxidoreductase [candidate division Zixibacteria bacterium]|nr:NAD(P)/FAD-dependent oxidoreductase [candidate division Zixibacteria bacterium]
MYKEITIIGAGPAGVASAIQLKREGFEPLVLEQKKVGGLLSNANLIENYPGFPDGISGKRLGLLLSEQLSNLRIGVKKEKVKHLTWRRGFFEIRTEMSKIRENKFMSRQVIVATGTVPKKINLPGAEDSSGKKLFYEITELPSTQGKKIIIIGGGDVAFDYALNLVSPQMLSEKSIGGTDCKVDLVFRDPSPKCLQLLLARAKKSKKINLFPETIPLKIREKEGKVFLDCCKSSQNLSSKAEKKFSLSSDYILVAIGRVPSIDFLSEELRSLYLQRDAGKALNRQKVSGIFFAGDVINGDYRQAGIAVGDGLACGMRIASLLKKEKLNS